MSDASTSPTHSPNLVVEHDADTHIVAEHDPEVNLASRTDSDELERGFEPKGAVDAVYRSQHADSGLDVSEDVDVEEEAEDDPQRDSSSPENRPAHKPTPPTISIPIPTASSDPARSPGREFTYASSPTSNSTALPSARSYTKPTVIPASVSLPIPNLTIDTSIASPEALGASSRSGSRIEIDREPEVETPKPDSAPPKTPVPVGQIVRTHRQARSVGPSMLEKVISKTRPTHLPPKNKIEDVKHMKDWEEMMEMSRVAERRKKQEIEERRLARERAVEDSIYVWKREILPNWREALRRPELRAMWWRGVPTKLRGQIWVAAIGNGLAIDKDTYKRCLARANRAMASGAFPVETLAIIEEDIRATLPALHIFHPETGPLYQDLKDLLCAWVVSRSDEGLGYVRGVSSVAGMFLINVSSEEAFICMRNLLERHCLRSFYGGPGARDDIEAYYRIFDTLLADGLPKVFFNFKQHQITPSQYLPDCKSPIPISSKLPNMTSLSLTGLLPMFLHHLPFEACARIWDVIILEGDSFLYRTALAIIAVIEPRLFFPDRKELMEVLQGENHAALEAAKRNGVKVDASARYEQYGMVEEVLWERIEGMEEWWKESTWSRLIQRELPDV